MTGFRKRPVALTIAGSDSGGGAGIQADLKTFAALGVHGTCALTCITAQHPRGVVAVENVSPRLLRRQIEAVFQELPPAAVKTGMLSSAKNISVVADFFKSISRKKHPLIIDPVMVATSGATLLPAPAIKRLQQELLPLAVLGTPNLSEAVILAGRKILSIDDMRLAAHEMHRRYGCAALVKGGHLARGFEAVDIFFDGSTELLLTAPRVKGVRTHGTGCTYSAAICAALASGQSLVAAVETAKNFISAAIADSYRVAGHYALNQFPPDAGSFTPDRHSRGGSAR